MAAAGGMEEVVLSASSTEGAVQVWCGAGVGRLCGPRRLRLTLLAAGTWTRARCWRRTRATPRRAAACAAWAPRTSWRVRLAGSRLAARCCAASLTCALLACPTERRNAATHVRSANQQGCTARLDVGARAAGAAVLCGRAAERPNCVAGRRAVRGRHRHRHAAAVADRHGQAAAHLAGAPQGGGGAGVLARRLVARVRRRRHRGVRVVAGRRARSARVSRPRAPMRATPPAANPSLARCV